MPVSRIFAAVLLMLPALSSSAQSGCTDPDALNYAPSATINDGSCTYPPTYQAPVLRGVLNTAITESSGVTYADGKLWTHNDSGNPPELFSIDTSDGHTLQRIVVDNYPNVDWEDITTDDDYIYVGDHGNNKGNRIDLKVLKIAKSAITPGATAHVNAQAISFSYTDQSSFVASNANNYDCEALMSRGDSLYIFTKDRGDKQTRVYKMPKTPGSYALTPYTGYDVKGLITGADYNAATGQVVLVGYVSTDKNFPFLWYLSDYQGDMFFSGNKRRIEMGDSREWQTEGVCWAGDHRIFVSCETTNSQPASLYASDNIFPPVGVPGSPARKKVMVYPNPVSDQLHVGDYAAAFSIFTMDGKEVSSGKIAPGTDVIPVHGLKPGAYLLKLSYQSGETREMSFQKQ